MIQLPLEPWDFSYFIYQNYVCTRYVEQLVASAEAAVEEVIRRGVSSQFFKSNFSISSERRTNLVPHFGQVAHPNKIAVGGHSYGAFMTANLLAHAPHLFCCGIARSGAYNRTLTPFGFQVYLQSGGKIQTSNAYCCHSFQFYIALSDINHAVATDLKL